MPVTVGHPRIARAAYRDIGKARVIRPAPISDCFAYALAIERDEPLLYTGDDFTRTDVRSALE